MASSDVDHWQCDKTLPQCMGYMLDNQIMCDVTFLLGEERYEVYAHKYMLASRSPVFHAMLEGPMAERGKIEIPDINKDTFEVFLRYVYTDYVSLTVGNVLQVMYASKKYCIDLLTKQCKDFLQDNITIDNACVLLDSALTLQEEDIFKSCLEKIKGNTESCITSSGFTCISRETLKLITELDDVILKEEVLYKQVMKWCDAECGRQQLEGTWENKREVLGDILYDIRFPLMDPKYFAEEMIGTELLTDKEKVEIMYYHSVQKPASHNLFSCNERCKCQVESVIRFSSIPTGKWNMNGLVDALGFMTSHDSILYGIFVYGSSSLPRTYTVFINIKDSTGFLLLNHNVNIDSNRKIELHEIRFTDPINVKANHSYRVELVMTGGITKAGQGGKKIVSYGKKTVRFFSSSPSQNGTNESFGQIPGLILK